MRHESLTGRRWCVGRMQESEPVRALRVPLLTFSVAAWEPSYTAQEKREQAHHLRNCELTAKSTIESSAKNTALSFPCFLCSFSSLMER